MDQAVLGRLALDFEVMHRLGAVPTLGPVRAYASAAAAQAGRAVSPERGMRGDATIYDISLTFPIPTSRQAATKRACVRFDLLAGGKYPSTAPLVRFVSTPLAWNPHVHPATGIVCTGPYWTKIALLAELVANVMRMLNFDVPHDGLGHFNPDAAAWWRERGHRPFTAGLAYPVVPVEVTHGVPARAVLRPRREPAARAAAQVSVLHPRGGSR